MNLLSRLHAARTPLPALLAGAAFPLAFAPVNQPVLAILSLAALLWLVLDATRRTAFQTGFFWGVGAFAVGVTWVHEAIHVFGGAPLALSLGLTAAFVAILSLFPALCLWALSRFFHTPGARLWAFAPLWVFSEALRGWLFTGFPWLFAGYSQTDTLLAFFAPLGSVWLVSLVVALSAAVLVFSARLSIATTAPVSVSKRVAILLMSAAVLATTFLPAPRAPETTAPAVKIAMVQGGIAQQMRWDRDQLQHIADTYAQLTAPLIGRADVIIWPESAIPAFAHQLRDVFTPLHNAAQEKNTALWFGVPVLRGERYYNSIIGLGAGDGEYSKRHLVPFGEYVPFESLLRGVFAFFDLPMSGFSEGVQGSLLKSPKLNAAGAICYEIAYPWLVRENVLGLADAPGVLLTVSNDAWFGDSWGPHQHFQIARMRAQESGLPLLRTTITGITAAVASDGRVTALAPQNQAAILRTQVQAKTAQTVWVKWGAVPLIFSSLLLLLIAGWRNRLKNSGEPPKSPSV